MGEEVKETQVVETAEENREEIEKEVKTQEKPLDETVQKNESYAEDIAELKALQLENFGIASWG